VAAREAELIFRGAASDPAWAGESNSGGDVGGGSAEFIEGQAGRLERLESVPLGAVRLAEQFGEGRFAELCAHIRAELRRVLVHYDRQRR